MKKSPGTARFRGFSIEGLPPGHAGLAEASVIASGYGSQGEVVARLGVLGPTRMDYPTTMAAVRAVARYVSRILNQ